jgi:outer membrane protein OmpA-like peptidoglycan-associated protein
MIRRTFLSIALVLFFATSYGQELEPTETEALLKVSVIDAMNKPLRGEKVSFTSDKTKKVYKGTTDTSGKFELLIPKGDVYNVGYKEFTSEASYKKYTVPAGNDLLSINYVIRVQLPKTFTLHNVFFDTGKATLKSESNKELDDLAEYLSYQKGMAIEVAGYTDNVGNDADNLKLSQARADAVRNYLIKKGVHAENLQAKGYGASDPVASNDTPEGKQQNRRTEVHILKQ